MCELIAAIGRNRALCGAPPVRAFCALYRRSHIERCRPPFSANIVAVCSRPTRNLVGIMTRRRRSTPATPAFLIQAPPERASFARRVQTELTHFPSPLPLIACMADVGGGSMSFANHPPPNANMSATYACNRRAFNATSESCASRAAVCAVMTSR